jgi:hypothetical protein
MLSPLLCSYIPRQEKEKTGPAWRTARYKEFYPDQHGQLPIYIPEPPNARSGWNTLMSFDELTQMLTNSVVFTGCVRARACVCCNFEGGGVCLLRGGGGLSMRANAEKAEWTTFCF